MFGFLQAPTLSCCGKAPEIWRSHFCGLGTRLHHDFGVGYRFLVNRDSTFLALLGGIGSEEKGRVSTCCNPFATPKRIFDSGAHMDYAADVTLCALNIKLRDDSEDEGWIRSFVSKVGLASFSSATDKAIARLNSIGFPTDDVLNTILSQDKVEANNPDACAAARPTAEAYQEIMGFSSGLYGDSSSRRSYEMIGHSLGRLIYWDDAWRDWVQDRKRGRYNPLDKIPHQELRELMSDEYLQLQSEVSKLPVGGNQKILGQTVDRTASRIPLANESPEEAARKSRRKEKKRRDQGSGSWWNCCDGCDCLRCCSYGRGGSKGGADGCFDCGPGDSGCIDCNPCDGCDCCPCN